MLTDYLQVHANSIKYFTEVPRNVRLPLYMKCSERDWAHMTGLHFIRSLTGAVQKVCLVSSPGWYVMLI